MNILDNRTRCLAIFAIIISPVLIASVSHIPQASAITPTTVVVPLYDATGTRWDPVIQAKLDHPSVPIVAVINNFGGPGSSADPNYAALVQRLHSAGITVIGYTYANYGARSSSAVESDMSHYRNWYNADGIFIDQMSYTGGDEGYYSGLTSYAKSIGMTLVIGNPGTETLPSYIGTVDAIVIYEDPGVPSIQYLGGWHANYDRTTWGVLPYGVDSLDTSFVTSAIKYVGYIGIGNGTDPAAWEPLPPYFEKLVATVDPTPQPPAGLSASTASSSEIDLSWTAPPSSGGYATTGYKIERSLDGGSTWGAIVPDTGSQSTTYQDTGLQSGTTYTYRVSSINPAGTSQPSNISSATTSAASTVPQPPTGLAATAASSSQINLSWNAPADNGGSPVTGYEISQSSDNGATWSVISQDTGSTSTTYADTGLSPSTTYTYQVSAINSYGAGPPSNTASATTQGASISGGITITNTKSVSGTTSSNSITIQGFYAGTGPDRLLLVGISADNNDVASVKFGGASLTRAAYSFYNNDAEFWYLKNPSGTGDITVTTNGPTNAVVGAYAISGVDQSDPIPTKATRHNTYPNSPTISITTTSPEDMVVDLPSMYGDSTLGSSTCSQNWDANIPSMIIGASSSILVQSPGTVTCSWTASSGDFWDDAAVELKSSGTAPQGIALDATRYTSGSTSSNIITLPGFGAGSGSNRLLLVGISANNNDVASVTFGGVPLKNTAYSFYNNDAEFWYLKNPSGTGDIIVTTNGPTQAVVGAYSFSGVNQTVPIASHAVNHNTSSEPTISITTTSPGDWVADLASIYGGSTLSGSTCMKQWNANMPNQITGASSSEIVPAPARVTCSWATNIGDSWDDAIVELNAAR